MTLSLKDTGGLLDEAPGVPPESGGFSGAVGACSAEKTKLLARAIVRILIWKGTQNKGINLVNWPKVSTPKALGGLGVHTAREANIALLGKLTWDLQQNKDKLWVQLLRHKYNVSGNFLTCNHRAGSPIWGAIMKAIDLLKGGYQFRLGAGEVSFWFDSWSDIGPLHQLLPYVDIHDTDLKLNEVFVNQEWGLNSLHTLLPDRLKCR